MVFQRKQAKQKRENMHGYKNSIFLFVKHIGLVLTCMFAVDSFAQSSFEKQYGKGMMVVTYDTNFVLNLYAAPNESALAMNVLIGLDSNTNTLNVKFKADQQSWFHPETFWDEERIMHFVTLENNRGWYKIIVDKNTGKTMWLLQSPQLKYFSWKDYLPNSVGIERKQPGTNPIYKTICPYKSILDFKEQNCLKIIKIKGNWAKVGFNAEICPHLNEFNTLPKGWIKWRDDKGLLINYFLR